MLRAPLPALEAGCVIEMLTSIRDHRPFSDSGAKVGFYLGDLNSPTRLVRFHLTAPASTQLNCRVQGHQAQPSLTTANSQQTLNVTVESMPPLAENLEWHLPSSMSPIPAVSVSTAQSWQAVAAEYYRQVEAQLRGDELPEFADVIAAAKLLPTKESAEKLLRAIHQRMRYTSVAFGNAAIVPRSPREVVNRGYGDCKDLSALYVSLLRVAGVEARLALVRSGPGPDVLADVPGLKSFDHAMVYVPRNEPRGQDPLWIDPTQRYLQVGELPAEVQGRQALIIDSRTKDLVKTTQGDAQTNRIEETVTLTIQTDGATQLRWSATYFGITAAGLREGLAPLPHEEQRMVFVNLGRQRFGTEALADFSFSSPSDLAAPLRLEATFRDASAQVVFALPTVAAVLSPAFVLDNVPLVLTGYEDLAEVPVREANDKTKIRRGPVQLPFMFRHRIAYRVVPPDGCTATQVPDDVSLEFAQTKLSVRSSRHAAHVETIVEFDSGNGEFTAAQAREMRKAVEDLGENKGYHYWQLVVVFEDRPTKLIADGNLQDAVKELRSLLEAHPDDATRHTQLAGTLLHFSLRDLALEHAERAVTLAPSQSFCHATLGKVLASNRLGQFCQVGFDRARAIRSYRQALELDPDDAQSRWEMGTILEHDDDAVRFRDTVSTDAAIEEFKRALAQVSDEALLDSLCTALICRSKFDEAQTLLSQRPSSPVRDIYLLAAIAVTEGIEPCFAAAQKMRRITSEQDELLTAAIAPLNFSRQYAVAANLAERLAENRPNLATRLENANALGRLSPFELPADYGKTPEDLVKSLLATALMFGPADQRLEDFFCNLPDAQTARGAFAVELDGELPYWLYQVRENIDSVGILPAIRMADNVAEMDVKVLSSARPFFRVAPRSAKRRS